MQESIYFYDLETTGLNPRVDRIMQFAGQRTDMDLNPIGEPDNILIRMTDDTLPSPGAIMVTGITPQSTLDDGMTEREFCEYFHERIATPNTLIMGYNSVRFDDEFMRALMWRNFYDPYAWQWRDRRSKWDILDVVRIVRALRPEGINWPVTEEGKPTNRLELITKENGITHEHAHDALSDVYATIAVAKLLKENQPQMYDFLRKMRAKGNVQKLVNLENPQPFVYASGRYGSGNNFTTVAFPIAPAENGNVMVYDLRYDPEEVIKEEKFYPVIKTLKYNHCPAVAPTSVLDKEDGWKKIGLTREEIEKNWQTLIKHPEIATLANDAAEKKKNERENQIEGKTTEEASWAKYARIARQLEQDAESKIYAGFLNDNDRRLCDMVRGNDIDKAMNYAPEFNDGRLSELLLHYKAKNYPDRLTDTEREDWEKYRRNRLILQSEKFIEEIEQIEKDLQDGKQFGDKTMSDCEYLLEELKLWYQGVQEVEF